MAEITRRSFFKTAGALGSIGLAAGLAGCAPSNTETAASGESSSNDSATTAGEPLFLTPPEAIADDAIANTVDADVVVVGAGTSGLVTALSALENGLSVQLFSASSAPVARGGSNCGIYSKAMEAAGVEKIPYDVVTNELIQASYMPDQQKWARYYEHSEESMNWLIDIMESAGYMTVLEQNAGFPATSPFYQPLGSHSWCTSEEPIAGGGQPLVVDTLAREIEKAGGTITYNTVAKQLVRGGKANGTEGRVEAVIAQAADGSYVKYAAAKAVVLATGDFSANREMMEKYCTWAAPFFEGIDEENIDYDITINMGGLYRGDGQRMGLWVGAAWQNIDPNCCMGGNICCGPWRQLQENFLGLLVNKNGQRYMNEAATSALGGMPALQQPDHTITAIWDSNYAAFLGDTWHPFGAAYGITPTLAPDEVVAQWNEQANNGAYIRADSLEELISMADLPIETLDTIKHYNELCAAGNDADFHKGAEYLAPIEQGPFFAASKDTPDAMTVLGGLRTNEHMQVCDENDEPLPGLYNVGTMVGDFYAGIYTFQLCGVNLGATCLTFGYLTGKHIAENE
ncbi:FAD-binding protein [Adlercreutzia sp. R7]|uniref:FAD-binding protein n=1 Tax=Adlercreutzia wanghongyangiae TaxID=3111451 RepID=A0ABU6II54_9ACTN|nr:FAD-binding protein [Adlercreutzia sp. R7]